MSVTTVGILIFSSSFLFHKNCLHTCCDGYSCTLPSSRTPGFTKRSTRPTPPRARARSHAPRTLEKRSHTPTVVRSVTAASSTSRVTTVKKLHDYDVPAKGPKFTKTLRVHATRNQKSSTTPHGCRPHLHDHRREQLRASVRHHTRQQPPGAVHMRPHSRRRRISRRYQLLRARLQCGWKARPRATQNNRAPGRRQ